MKKEEQSFMKKVSRFIVGNYGGFLLLFLLMAVFCTIAIKWTGIENDIKEFLSDKTETKQSLAIAEEEFTTLATVQVLVENISIGYADKTYEAFQKLDNVYSVTFDPDNGDFKDYTAYYIVNLLTEAGDEESKKTLNEIKAYLDSEKDLKYYINTEIGSNIAEEISKEMFGVVLLAAAVVLVVLLLTSKTYAEIIPLVLSFIFAAIINKGTNFMLGNISLISDSIAIILQLALSIDYAIIFRNRYCFEHNNHPVKESVSIAITKAVPEIAASSLTTMAGLFAMTLMEFKLGADMGIVLIKSILISMLTVFFFLPGLFIVFGKLMDKTEHRNFVPKVGFIGKFAGKSRFIVPLIFCVVLVFAGIQASKCNYAYEFTYVPTYKDSESTLAQKKITAFAGEYNPLSIIVTAGDYESEMKLAEALLKYKEVKNVICLPAIEAKNGYRLGDKVTYKDLAKVAGVDDLMAKALFAYYAASSGGYREAYDSLENFEVYLIDILDFLIDNVDSKEFSLTDEQKNMVYDVEDDLAIGENQLRGTSHDRIIVTLNLPFQSDESFAFMDTVHKIGEQYYPEGVILGGETSVDKDFKESFTTDNVLISILTILFVVIILFVTFKSVALPVILILIIQGSIWMNFAIPAFTQSYVFFVAYLIVSAIQMGANIDYAIVISSGYLELQDEYPSPRERIKETMNRVFPTLITSGTIMIAAGLLIGFMVSQGIVSSIGYYVGIGSLISIILVLFVLPSILVFCDSIITSTMLSFAKIGRSILTGQRSKRVLSIIMIAASAITLIISAINLNSEVDDRRTELQVAKDNLEKVEELKKISESYNLNTRSYAQTSYNFAERLLTDLIGSDEIDEGRKEYESGQAAIEDKQKEYDEGMAYYLAMLNVYNEGIIAYEKGLAEYEAGKKALEEGKEVFAEYQNRYNQGKNDYNIGKAAYEAGVKAYEAGRQQYAEGYEQYIAGKQYYEQMLSEYQQGKAAYEAGYAEFSEKQREYNEGKALYDQKLKEFNEGLALYEAGKEKYENGLKEYNDGLASYESITPIYNLVIDSYRDYLDLRAEYDQAVANGNTLRALQLWASVVYAETVYKAKLSSSSYSIEEIINEYESAPARLAEAKKQLEEGKKELEAYKVQISEGREMLASAEAELAEGKRLLESAALEIESGRKQLEEAEAQLESGSAEILSGEGMLASVEAELKAGEQQIATGRSQLASAEEELSYGASMIESGKAYLDGAESQLASAEKQLMEGEETLAAGSIAIESARAQLDDGQKALASAYEQLAFGKSQVESGEEFINENGKQLEGDLAILDQMHDERLKLDAGVSLLMNNKEIKKNVGYNKSYENIISCAIDYYNERSNSLTGEIMLVNFGLWALIAAGLWIAICAIMWLVSNEYNLLLVFSGLGIVLAFAGIIMIRSCNKFFAWILALASLMVLSAVLRAVIYLYERNGGREEERKPVFIPAPASEFAPVSSEKTEDSADSIFGWKKSKPSETEDEEFDETDLEEEEEKPRKKLFRRSSKNEDDDEFDEMEDLNFKL